MNKLLLLIIVITGSNQSPFSIYNVITGSISLPFSIYNVITGSNRSLFSIHKVFTRSNWSFFFDLQCYYRVKLVTIFRFTRLLQGELSLPFSIFSVFTVWNDSYSFRFTGISHNIYQVVVDYFIYLHVIYRIFWQYLRYIYMILHLEPLHFTGLSSIFTCSAPNIYTSFTVTFNIL